MATIRLAFYYRIFPILLFRRLLVWVAVFSLFYMISVDLAILVQWYIVPVYRLSTLKLRCSSRPIHYFWDRVDGSLKGHCFNVDAFFIGSGSINVSLNFLIFVLVCPRRNYPDER